MVVNLLGKLPHSFVKLVGVISSYFSRVIFLVTFFPFQFGSGCFINKFPLLVRRQIGMDYIEK